MEELRLHEKLMQLESYLRQTVDAIGRARDQLEEDLPGPCGIEYADRQLTYAQNALAKAQEKLGDYWNDITQQATQQTPQPLTEVLAKAFPKEPFQFLRIPPMPEGGK